MQKNNQVTLNAPIARLLMSFILSISLITFFYLFFKQLGFEEQMNRIDRTLLVSWRRLEFNPKRYFKLFYNLSLFLIPTLTLIFSTRLTRTIKKDFSISLAWLSTLFGWQDRMVTRYKLNSKLEKFINKNHVAILFGLLFLVLFNFGYLLETGIWINYYHHNFIVAPINDLFAGKHLLVDTFSQYGMLLPFFLYQIFKWLLPFSYMNLYFVFMLGTMVYYFILYFFLLKLTKSKLYSLFGLFFLMGVQTLLNYPVYPVSENYVWPGATVLRYFFDIPVFLLLYKNKNLASTPLFVVTSSLTAMAVLYNLETGLALSVGFMVFIFIVALSKSELSWRNKVAFLLRHLFIFVIALALMSLFFSTYTLSVSGHWPNWNLMTKFVVLAQEGISNINTPLLGWHLPILVLYFLSIIFALERIQTKKTVSWLMLIIAGLASYGLMLSNYYISRSVLSNLTVVSLPAGIIVIILIKQLSTSRDKAIKLIRAILLIFFVFILGLSSYFLVKRLQYRVYAAGHVEELKKYPGNRAFYVVSYDENKGRTVDDLFDSVAAIKELSKGQKKVLLFSRFDTIILVMAEKTQVLPVPMMEQFYYKRELEWAKKMLTSLNPKPKYIFVDKIDARFPPPSSYEGANELFDSIKPFYVFYKRVGILEIYQLKTKDNY